jgi:hypothetical protein
MEEVEGIIWDWIMMLSEDDQRHITNPGDIIECINEEAEEEIKTQLWELAKSRIDYNTILNNLRLHLHNIIETDYSSDEEGEEQIVDSDTE